MSLFEPRDNEINLVHRECSKVGSDSNKAGLQYQLRQTPARRVLWSFWSYGVLTVMVRVLELI